MCGSINQHKWDLQAVFTPEIYEFSDEFSDWTAIRKVKGYVEWIFRKANLKCFKVEMAEKMKQNLSNT